MARGDHGSINIRYRWGVLIARVSEATLAYALYTIFIASGSHLQTRSSK